MAKLIKNDKPLEANPSPPPTTDQLLVNISTTLQDITSKMITRELWLASRESQLARHKSHLLKMQINGSDARVLIFISFYQF
jgi:hypothetical protein